MLYTQAQIAAALNTVIPDMGVIFDSLAGVAQVDGETYLVFNNLEYVAGESPVFYQEIALDVYEGVTPTATEMLLPSAVVDADTGVVLGTTATQVPATTTPVGAVKAGALAGRLPIGTAIAGIAIGAGIGLYEVKRYPKFWNDLSNAIFNDIKNPTSGPISDPFSYNETIDVLWRMLSDGSIQAYCDKRDVDKIVHNLYEKGAFNVLDHLDTSVDTAGVQDVPIGDTDDGYVDLTLFDSGITSPYLHAFYDQGIARYPGSNVVKVQSRKNTDSGYGLLRMDYYSLSEGSMEVLGTPGNLYVNASDSQKKGSFTANLNPDGSIINYSFDDGAAYTQTVINIGSGTSTSGVFVDSYSSNLGSEFIHKNPAVIYNGTDVLPPEDEADFWDTFSEWLDNGFEVPVYNPQTNSVNDKIYLPFMAPDINWQTDPVTAPQTQPWEGIYPFADPFEEPTSEPVSNPDPWIFPSIGRWPETTPEVPEPTPWDNKPKFPNPTPSPVGSTPTIVAPTSGVGGSKLYSVYNPSQANVDALGAYLWTENIIDKIEQFFKNSPLEAIISLHMIYCTPSTGTSKNIYLGYLDSGVSAPTVNSQYVDIACGYVDIPELYGNVLDYTGVSVQVFLPFIGFKVLKTKEVMGKRLDINYKVDVYTGTCLAMLYVISANTRQLLYTYEGNCSVQIPLTASDRTRLISGLITAGISAFTSNPAGVVGGIASIGVNIDRSGSFSGNAGAMGVKKPYIVISRAINAQATGYNTMYGYPLNKYGYLQNFRGFTRCKSVHVDISIATSDEIDEIEAMLKEGIII